MEKRTPRRPLFRAFAAKPCQMVGKPSLFLPRRRRRVTIKHPDRGGIPLDRIRKENYYLDLAQTVLERATWLRRVYGAIIVKNDEIISTGYNGAPRGRANCVDMGYCSREAMRVPRGERYELCRSVHAEANAIISASRRDMVGGTIYLVGRDARTGELLSDATSCPMCRRLVINAGLSRVVIRRTETEFDVVDVREWVEEDDLLSPVNIIPPDLP